MYQLPLTLDYCQRWDHGHSSYHPPAETIRTVEYEVAAIADDTTPRRFIEQHHYAGSYPSARFRFGLYHHAELVGVAVFSHPCSNKVLTNVFPSLPVLSTVELGRFVLLDEVPANGESFFAAACFHRLRQHDILGIVAFSDPLPRPTRDGSLRHLGHVGRIYQALNALYLGRSTPRSLRLFPDGSVLSDRTLQKLRQEERGWRAAAALLESHGASSAPADATDRIQWLANALPTITTKLPHHGNHRYAFPLSRHARIALLDRALPYPKFLDPTPTRAIWHTSAH